MLKGYCRMCDKKTQNSAIYCCKECEEKHYECVLVTIPARWVKNTLERLNCYERFLEAVKFSKRHNIDEELVFRKIQRMYSIRICKELT
jgi:hypothetical protein